MRDDQFVYVFRFTFCDSESIGKVQAILEQALNSGKQPFILEMDEVLRN